MDTQIQARLFNIGIFSIGSDITLHFDFKEVINAIEKAKVRSSLSFISFAIMIIKLCVSTIHF